MQTFSHAFAISLRISYIFDLLQHAKVLQLSHKLCNVSPQLSKLGKASYVVRIGCSDEKNEENR
jgi:hypothetical protein